MSLLQISEATGISTCHIQRISSGAVRTVLQSTAWAISRAKPEPMRSASFRDSTGTRRRVQALACLGYSYAAQADLVETVTGRRVTNDAVSHWMTNPMVTHAVAEDVARVYEKYAMVPRDLDNTVARRSRKKGWAPPLAWDDDTIDDPKAKPDFGNVQGLELPDEAAIAMAMSGQRHKIGRPLNNAEKRIAIERAFELGLSDSRTAELIGIRRGSVCATRVRMRWRAEEAEAEP
jgi:hypothetical protein